MGREPERGDIVSDLVITGTNTAAHYEITLASNGLNIGHSLTEQPSEMMRSMLAQTGGGVAEMHVRSGTNPKNNWLNDTPGAGRPGKTVLAEGNTDYIWITETSAPHYNLAPWTDQGTQPWDAVNEVYLNQWDAADPETGQNLTGWRDWVNLAAANGVTRAFVYQPWIDLTGSEDPASDPYAAYAWADRGAIEARLMGTIRDYLQTGDHAANNYHEAALPAAGLLGVHMIPSSEFLIHIKSILDAGSQPAGVSYADFEADLFSDTIHLNDHGAYGMACLVYSVIYRASPVGLPRATANRYGTPYTTMSVDDAAWWQSEAWAFANNHALTGL